MNEKNMNREPGGDSGQVPQQSPGGDAVIGRRDWTRTNSIGGHCRPLSHASLGDTRHGRTAGARKFPGKFPSIAGLILALTLSAHASEPPLIEPDRGAMGIHTVSWHSLKYSEEVIHRDAAGKFLFVTGKEFCNINPGVYYKHPSGWTGGIYRNSVCKVSVYLGYTFETESKRFALTVGGVTNYQEMGARGPIAPLFVPSVAFRLDRDFGLTSFGPTTVRAGWMPGFPKKEGGKTRKPVHAITLMLERPF